MKHQRNFFVSVLKFILITAAVIILLLFVSCLLFSFYYKDISSIPQVSFSEKFSVIFSAWSPGTKVKLHSDK